jgi:hypothetical protein
MRTSTRNRRRTQLRVESLEGKTLLSTGGVMDLVAPRARAAPIVAQATAFGGTLTGTYSNVHVPGFANVLSYKTSGTLSGIGSTRLRGTFFRGLHAPIGRLIGQFALHNNGGSMILNVFRLATPGTYSYKVARARGSDAAFRGERGTLMIAQTPTLRVPFFTSGQATMTFTPS